MRNGFIGRMCPKLSPLNISERGLQEATIPANDFGCGVAGEGTEGRRAVYDGVVEPPCVDNDERASEVNGTQDDSRVRPRGYSCKNAQ